MKRGSFVGPVSMGVLLALAACAGTHRVPVGDVPAPRLTADRLDAERMREAAQPIDQDASSRFLESEGERKSQLPPPRPRVEIPPPQPVERIVYVPSDDPYYSDYYYHHGYRHGNRYGRYGRVSSFPTYTLTGAAVGAIIGHNSRHGRHRSGRGALIGAGAGLLLDVFGRRY